MRYAVEKIAPRKWPCCWFATLTDGFLGTVNDLELEWLGFLGTDLEVVVDLGLSMRIRRLCLDCLESSRDGIFLPKETEFAVSLDGTQLRVVGKIESTPPSEHVPRRAHCLATGDLDVTGRYVRLRATRLARMPTWVGVGDSPAWFFVGEILVNPQLTELGEPTLDELGPSPAVAQDSERCPATSCRGLRRLGGFVWCVLSLMRVEQFGARTDCGSGNDLSRRLA